MFPDQGTLGETAAAKLLLSFYEQNQTGILYFRQNEILKVFYLNRGKISWAISSDEADKIEHILLAKKMVTPELALPLPIRRQDRRIVRQRSWWKTAY